MLILVSGETPLTRPSKPGRPGRERLSSHLRVSLPLTSVQTCNRTTRTRRELHALEGIRRTSCVLDPIRGRIELTTRLCG
jgi:hypothetical protein